MRTAAMVKSFLTVFLSILLISCGSTRASIMAPDSGFESNVNYQAHQPAPDLESYQPESDEEVSQNGETEEISAPQAKRATPSAPTAPVDNRRMITYSHTLELVLEHKKEIIEKTRMSLIEQIKSNKGFIIGERDGSITARIPPENMDAFLAFARTLGKVEHESRRGADITDQYRDNISRLNSLKHVRDRYLALLEQAHNVTDMLRVEKELERINTEIEVLEGRIRHAEQSVAFSLITVEFRKKTILGPLGWVFYGTFWAIGALFVWD
ncbi:MAG: DUF4349 domain-containing protein [Chitinispirillia bacterium]|nr:DUF4349 domain-containing protein [Chitinispirillia bacterium]